MKNRAAVFCLLLLAFSSPVRAETNTTENWQLLLLTRKFDTLEAIAADMRKTDARTWDSYPRLGIFYRNLSSVPPKIHGNCGWAKSPIPFEAKLDAMTKWIEQKPKSITARIAMAELWFQYAWDARGCGYASTIKPEEYKLFHERVAKAISYMQSLNPKDDPYIYVEFMQLTQTIGGGRQELDSLYAAAVRDFPTYFPFYSIRADLLQPKWFGRPGEVASYVQSLLKSPGGETGYIAYIYAAQRLVWQYQGSNQDTFIDLGLFWPDLQKAYAILETRYGLQPNDRDYFLYFAYVANDKEVAAGILRRKDYVRSRIWTPVNKFWEIEEWALGSKWPTRAETDGAQMVAVNNWTDPAKLGALLQNPGLKIDVTKLDLAKLPPHVQAGLFTERDTFDIPQLETAAELDIADVTAFSAPKLQSAGDIKTASATSFDAPLLEAASVIDARAVKTLNVPKLRVAGDVSPELVENLSLPALQNSGHIITNATNVDLPALVTSGNLYVTKATNLHAPLLQNVEGRIDAYQLPSVDLPSLQYVLGYIYDDQAKTFHAPDLRLTGELRLGQLERLSVQHLQYAGDILIASGGLSELDLPELRLAGNILACNAKKFESASLQSSGYIDMPLVEAFDAPQLQSVSSFIYIPKAASFKAPEFETIANHIFFARTATNFDVPKLQDAENRVLPPADSNFETPELKRQMRCAGIGPQPHVPTSLPQSQKF